MQQILLWDLQKGSRVLQLSSVAEKKSRQEVVEGTLPLVVVVEMVQKGCSAAAADDDDPWHP